MINYESELSERFQKELSILYGVGEEMVIGYFHLRYLIASMEKEVRISSAEITEFLLKELNLPREDGFYYKEEYISQHFHAVNCVQNIVDDWLFRVSLKTVVNSKGISISFEEYIQNEFKKIFRHGRNKAKPFKCTKQYESYLKWHSLSLLNNRYQATPTPPKQLSGVQYPVGHNFFARTLEETCNSNIHASERKTDDVSNITENELESYLIKHLDLLEEGLRYLDNQYSIRDGRIDILARDKVGNYVIIELKVQEDKELIWQTIYYPMQFKKEHQGKVARMITVCPEYPEHILAPLRQVSGVEMIRFIPEIELGKIKGMEMKRIS